MKKLSLYYYPSCPYCRRVTRVLDGLDVEVELRNTLQNPEHQTDLIAARGRRTVPVLRIEQAGEPDVWMPESGDIVKYLRMTYGDGSHIPVVDLLTDWRFVLGIVVLAVVAAKGLALW